MPAPDAIEVRDAEILVLKAENVLELLEIDYHLRAGFRSDDARQVEDLVAGNLVDADFEGKQGVAVHLDGTLFHLFAPERGEIFQRPDVEKVDEADDQVVAAGTNLLDCLGDDGLFSAAGFPVDGQAPASLFEGGDNRSDFIGAAEDAVAGGDFVKGKREVHQEI